jgi:hypothetical protein
MSRGFWLWLVALLVTVLSARYQRTTGPTVPFTGKATLGPTAVAYSLERTHAGAGDQVLRIQTADASIGGAVAWRHHGTEGPWTTVPLQRAGIVLIAALPHQPPAGKLDYRVRLERDGQTVVIPADHNLRLRFRNDVPLPVLVPHIIAMFLAMMLSTRAGLEAFRRRPSLKRLAIATLIVFFIAGFVFGPLMTRFAFGEWWGGWPFGNDPTDTKTELALVGWLLATVFILRGKAARAWAVTAALLMILVFAIPHSTEPGERPNTDTPTWTSAAAPSADRAALVTPASPNGK